MRVANPLMRTAITSRLGRRIPFAVLSFAGRRSGKAYSVPVGVYEVDGVATVFTDGTWRFNFRDERNVTVILRGERRTGHATLVEDRARVGEALSIALRTAKPRDVGLAIDKGYTPSPSELAEADRDMVQITFDGD
jgi:hypothetical protein